MIFFFCIFWSFEKFSYIFSFVKHLLSMYGEWEKGKIESVAALDQIFSIKSKIQNSVGLELCLLFSIRSKIGMKIGSGPKYTKIQWSVIEQKNAIKPHFDCKWLVAYKTICTTKLERHYVSAYIGRCQTFTINLFLIHVE